MRLGIQRLTGRLGRRLFAFAGSAGSRNLIIAACRPLPNLPKRSPSPSRLRVTPAPSTDSGFLERSEGCLGENRYEGESRKCRRLGENKTKRAGIPSAEGFTMTNYCSDFSPFGVLLPAIKTCRAFATAIFFLLGQALGFRRTIR